MRRALLALVIAAGCTPTVILGTLSVDGGEGDLAGTCFVCDLSHRDLGDLASGFDLRDGGLIPSDGLGSDGFPDGLGLGGFDAQPDL
jgi:hypothetical protein